MIGVVVRPVRTSGKLAPRVARAMRKASSRILISWKALARQRLRTTYAAYTAGIQREEYGGAPKVGLVGRWPRALETGFPRFDLKPGLLSRHAVRVSWRQPKKAYMAKVTKLGKLRASHLAGRAPKRSLRIGRYTIVPIGLVGAGPNVRGSRFTRAGVLFRTVTDSPQSRGKWIHPGYAGVRLLPRVRVRATAVIREELSREFGRRGR